MTIKPETRFTKAKYYVGGWCLGTFIANALLAYREPFANDTKGGFLTIGFLILGGVFGRDFGKYQYGKRYKPSDNSDLTS